MRIREYQATIIIIISILEELQHLLSTINTNDWIFVQDSLTTLLYICTILTPFL